MLAFVLVDVSMPVSAEPDPLAIAGHRQPRGDHDAGSVDAGETPKGETLNSEMGGGGMAANPEPVDSLIVSTTGCSGVGDVQDDGSCVCNDPAIGVG